jgi:hypothetical protein
MLIDCIVELLFEIFAEGFISLCEEFIPEKLRSAKTRCWLTVVFLILAAALLVGLVFGVIALVEHRGRSLFGWVMVGLSSAYLLAGVLRKVFRKDPEDPFSEIS